MDSYTFLTQKLIKCNQWIRECGRLIARDGGFTVEKTNTYRCKTVSLLQKILHQNIKNPYQC